MSVIVILLISVVLLIAGYVLYGGWLAKQWGVDPDRETPAHAEFDGKDYVPSVPSVLLGHHFSSVSSAGSILGPIRAAIFGWIPVMLWIIVGGIFFGVTHDFGSLLASVRHGGKSIGEVLKDSMGVKAQRLFTVFALLLVILIIASFTSVVADTFASEGAVFSFGAGNVSVQASTATASILFIGLAFIFSYFVYRKNASIGIVTVIGILGIVLIIFAGLNFGVNADRTVWILVIAVYIIVASLLPVWMLLQPRDYLSSFLLYGMMILSVVGIVGSGMKVEIPSFAGWSVSKNTLFPTLFITVACGAVSGFHSLISSGTTSKQLSSEKDAKMIGAGAMLLESAVAIVALCAAGVVWSKVQAGDEVMKMTDPATVFAGGIATMIAKVFGETAFSLTYTLISLAVSVFALTSLDSAARLARYLLAELFVPEGKTGDSLTGAAKFFSAPPVATLIVVVIGCGIGFLGLSPIWEVFGAANQLLAAIAMLAVTCWLGRIGKNNKMFYFPMGFLFIATFWYLLTTIIKKFSLVSNGSAAWGDWFQIVWSAALIVLAVFFAVEGIRSSKRYIAED